MKICNQAIEIARDHRYERQFKGIWKKSAFRWLPHCMGNTLGQGFCVDAYDRNRNIADNAGMHIQARKCYHLTAIAYAEWRAMMTLIFILIVMLTAILRSVVISIRIDPAILTWICKQNGHIHTKYERKYLHEAKIINSGQMAIADKNIEADQVKWKSNIAKLE